MFKFPGLPGASLKSDSSKSGGLGFEFDPQWFPTYKPGHWYFCNSPGAISTGQTGVGILRVSPWVVTKQITVVRFGAELTAAGDAASLLRVGIYADDGGGKPAARVAELGSISGGSGNAGSVATGGTPGPYEITCNLTLPPGLYWAGGATQGVTTTQPTWRVIGGGSIVAPIPMPIQPTASMAVVGYTAGAGGVLPETWNGTQTSGSAVRFWFKTAD